MQPQTRRDRPHFRAHLIPVPASEGGRSKPFVQGPSLYRPTLHFSEKDVYIGLVGVDFLDDSGNSLPEGARISTDVDVDIYVVDDNVVLELRRRVALGRPFDVTEGTFVVAKGRILSLGTLFD